MKKTGKEVRLLKNKGWTGKELLNSFEVEHKVHSKQKNHSGTQTATTFQGTNKRLRKALTLVEVMVAIVILSIALIGTSSMYVSGRRQIIKQGQYQEAVHLTSQKLEQIKAIGYSGITQGEQEEELPLCGLTCKRHTKIESTATPTASLPNPCKKVTVTVQWAGAAEDQHEVKLVTYIGP